MKKLAYIILVIAILVVISHFVKQGNIKPAAEDSVATVVTTEDADAIADTTTGNAPVSAEAAEAAVIETTAPAEDNDVVDVQENAEDIIIEEGAPEDDGAVDVEETNPEETIDEEETIVKE